MSEVLGRAKAPWHLWVIGVVSLLWNAIGVYDYVMTQSLDTNYLESAGMTGDQLAWLAQFPWWANAAWALGVWGAVLGSVLLLLRSRYSLTAYILSLIGIVPMTFYQFGSDHPGSLNGTVPTIFAVVLIAVTLAQAWYAWRMRMVGVLR